VSDHHPTSTSSFLVSVGHWMGVGCRDYARIVVIPNPSRPLVSPLEHLEAPYSAKLAMYSIRSDRQLIECFSEYFKKSTEWGNSIEFDRHRLSCGPKCGLAAKIPTDFGIPSLLPQWGDFDDDLGSADVVDRILQSDDLAIVLNILSAFDDWFLPSALTSVIVEQPWESDQRNR
jgi:hypothetical protein